MIMFYGTRVIGKGKGKVHPITDHDAPEVEERYSSTLSLTSALDGVGGQRHAPAALRPGKTRYPAGWAADSVWTGAENLPIHRDSIPGPSSP